jgi:peptide/nickel transport system substrate-binding protein
MKKEGIFKRVAGLTLAASMAFSLTACGGSASSDTTAASGSTGASTSAAATSIDRDATVSVGSTAQQFLGHFDICQLFSTECSTAAGYLVYDQLFSIGSDGVWYSDILESYEWSTEVENQLVMTLKDNIYFSNGDQMTMEDVLYSMQRFASSTRGAANFSVIDFDATTISDDGMTLYLQYNQEYGPWQSGLNIFVMDKSFVEGLGDSPDWFSKDSVCGSGPYTVTESITDTSITFERRDDWWQADEVADTVASAKTIVAYKYTDDTTMMADYINGVIDVAINITSDDCEEIAADSSMGTYIPVSSNASAVIVLSPENEILQNEKIRQAICIGVDAEAIAEQAFGILGEASKSTLNESNPYFVDGHAYTYDPDTAKQLVEESGISNPTLTFVTNTAGTSTKIAESFQYYMEQIGITVNVESYDQSTAVADYWTQNGGTDFFINAAAIATASNEAADVYTFYRQSFAYTCCAQTDPEIIDLLEQGRGTTDETERAQIYSDIQDWFYDNYSMIPIAQWSTAYAYNSRIGTCDIPITGSPSLRNISVIG